MTKYYRITYKRPEYLDENWDYVQTEISEAVLSINSNGSKVKALGPFIFPSCDGVWYYVENIDKIIATHIIIILDNYPYITFPPINQSA